MVSISKNIIRADNEKFVILIEDNKVLLGNKTKEASIKDLEELQDLIKKTLKIYYESKK